MNYIPQNLNVYIKTTNECQLDCDHCYASNSKKDEFDPEKTFLFMKELASALPVIRSINYSFHGGEPLMCGPEKIQTFIDYHEKERHLSRISSFGIQTNLIYGLDHKTLNLLKEFDSIGTSWDYKIRFNTSQEDLWARNVRTINSLNIPTHLTICLTKELIKTFPAKELIQMAINLGFKGILFERLTTSGSAILHPELFPSIPDQNQWLFDMWEYSVKEQTYNKIHNMFLEPTARTLIDGAPSCGQRRCRQCETSVLTINPNGTISGCPDKANQKIIGSIEKNPIDIMYGQSRIVNILAERNMSVECLDCLLYDVCRGDCQHQYQNANKCVAPKEMMEAMKKTDSKIIKKFL